MDRGDFDRVMDDAAEADLDFAASEDETRRWIAYAERADLAALQKAAAARRDAAFGMTVTYSPNVFIPLTKLCRDTCRYCVFAERPSAAGRAYMSIEEVDAVVRAGEAAGCREALFTLGDKPELRYRAAAEELRALGHDDTISYLVEIADHVAATSALTPHINAGVMGEADLLRLRDVSGSQGLMLESVSQRLCEKGGPHFGSPDKEPAARLATIAAAGAAQIPFTTGILVGIGETEAERIESLVAIAALHRRFGHVQEAIIQNFEPKPGTKMASSAPPPLTEYLRAVALARLILPAEISVQAPPNLNPDRTRGLLASGVDDLGGVSPVTIDHVNPEAPWPRVEALRAEVGELGFSLAARHCVGPRFIRDGERWLAPAVRRKLLAQSDSRWLLREDDWEAARTAPPAIKAAGRQSSRVERILAGAENGERLGKEEIVALFESDPGEAAEIAAAADRMRRRLVGDAVTFVVNRNINYTNICGYKCRFCAFSKGKTSDDLRGKPYRLSLDEIAGRAVEAERRGATEVCLQGGIHPEFDGETYLEICRAVKSATPAMHIHAFSPLEVSHGASTLGLSVASFLERLQREGLGSLPGTAAEVLDDRVRAKICPDKLNTSEWLDVIRTAHKVGLRTTATIMFGHVDEAEHWANHLLHLRALQEETGGLTEFVPLPFVAAEAPIFLKGESRRGPTFREALLMHSVARLAFGETLPNIQASWVKMTPQGAAATLDAGANDMGGVLMNESITRAAGALTGQELTEDAIRKLILEAGRAPQQRTTLYRALPEAA